VAGLPRASASFLSDSLIDVVAETILHADSSDSARAIVDEIAEAFEACAVAVDADGMSVSYSEMSFPQLGDSTVAYRAIPHASTPPVSLVLVAVAVGDKIVLLVGGGAGGTSPCLNNWPPPPSTEHANGHPPAPAPGIPGCWGRRV
jgi:hypothetical protein